ncbi:hypothetical protein ACFODL_15390 [Phenylobacterium terrae]|uniref:Uncharacterized protein n=1 Tax=Phenylobacterium terrae TaxID=2665495 RepID=A0ABW4N6Y5_9CAUL
MTPLENFLIHARLLGADPLEVFEAAYEAVANIMKRIGMKAREPVPSLRDWATAVTILVEQNPVVFLTIEESFRAIAEAGEDVADLLARCEAVQ